MSRLFKQSYTKPIPEGAEIGNRKGERLARFRCKGQLVTAPLTENGDRIRLETKNWYGEYQDENDKTQCVPLATDGTAAAQMLAALVRKAELARAGCRDP